MTLMNKFEITAMNIIYDTIKFALYWEKIFKLALPNSVQKPYRASLSFTPPFSLILLNLEDRYWTRKGTIILDRHEVFIFNTSLFKEIEETIMVKTKI